MKNCHLCLGEDHHIIRITKLHYFIRKKKKSNGSEEKCIHEKDRVNDWNTK